MVGDIGGSIVKLMHEVNRLDKIIAADTKEIAALKQTIKERDQELEVAYKACKDWNKDYMQLMRDMR